MKPLSLQQAMEQAVAHHEAGRLREAEILYRQILTRDPRHADAMNLFGVLAHQLGHNDIAEQYITRALQYKPGSAAYLVNLGVAQAGLSKFELAMSTFQKALEIDPQNAFALGNLAQMWMKQGAADRAIALARKALDIRPEYHEALNILGIALQSRGDLQGAMSAFEKTRGLRPEAFQPHNNIGNALKDMGKIEDAIIAYRHSCECKSHNASSHSNMLYAMQFSTKLTAEDKRRAREDWNARYAAPLEKEIKPHDNDQNPDRILRIGYLSPDFRDHSTSNFSRSLLSAHDPSVVEVFAYPNLPRFDEMSARIQKLVPHWHDLSDVPDKRALEIINQDRIDILVDLAGHTAGNRLLLFCRKPAPIQINYLGYPDVTGVPTIDYRFTDVHADPPGIASEGEELLRLPETFLCFAEPIDSPPTVDAPCSRNGFITFGSFNPLAKLNPVIVKYWAEILNQVPNAKMMIKTRALDDAGAARNVIDLFSAAGIGEDRLILRGFIKNKGQHLAAYGDFDIALDPFPYHGTTTTCECLWMGVPLVSLAGNAHVNRVGASLLTNVGLSHLIAKTSEDYVRLAVELANRPPMSRSELRERMKSSPLMDAPRFAHNVEKMYREVWHRWLSR